MATFPALTPNSRTFTPGDYPHAVLAGWNGAQNRTRYSNVMLESQLRAGFRYLSEAEMLSVLSHYNGQLGTFESFDLPDDLWLGVSNPDDYTLSGYLWRYAEPPQVEDLPWGRYNVEIVLETVPPEGAVLTGFEKVIRITLTAGAAAAANGIVATIGVQVFNPSAVYGLLRKMGLSLTAGDATVTDPQFSSVSLLLHMNGSNASTTFADSSNNAQTVSVFGNAQISTARAKFGTASGLFDGTGDYLTAPSGTLYQFGTGDFTVETWLYVATWGQMAIYDNTPIGGNGNRTNSFLWYLKSDGRLALFSQSSERTTSSATVPTGEWVHVALTRVGSTWRYFINGTLDSNTVTLSANVTTNGCVIGRIGDAEGFFLNGNLDDLRITKGVARYTATFTPPTRAFPDS